MPSVIYDIGANNGSNISYYLQKAEHVVAVEANPLLCTKILEMFPAALAAGSLTVVNAALVDADSPPSTVPFYINMHDDVRSQLPPPAPSQKHEFKEITVNTTSLPRLIHDHGQPSYMKFDVEGYDHILLRALFRRGIRPPFISAECHTPEVFASLASLGHYSSFKFVDGLSVPDSFHSHRIATMDGPKMHTFPSHSAGPFGDDIPGPWLSTAEAFRELRRNGLGWKDLHAKAAPADSPHATNARDAIRYRYYTLVLENDRRPYWKRFVSRLSRLLHARP